MYYVAHKDFTAADLRKHLSQKLPDYMLPAYFIRVDKIPLMPNGKVDRSRLPEPEVSGSGTDKQFVAPDTPVEEKLAEIWSEVIHIDQIGIYDNFLDLGGNSLLAVQITSRVLQAFQLELPLNTLFETSTIAELAEIIEDALLEEIENLSEAQVQHLLER